MKILHVVTYVSPDGAFGGPTRVALGQAAALAERGHDVSVYAGAPRKLAETAVVDGFTLRTFPAYRVAPTGGFAMLAAPAMLRALRQNVEDFDVAHVHLARDLVTLPALHTIRTTQIPYVAQTHGMIDQSEHLLSRPLDAFLTRPLLRHATSVLTLTDRERIDIQTVEPRAHTRMISNGVKVPDVQELSAMTDREKRVLFLARLAPRKRPLAFVEMAKLLETELPDYEFVIAGPDEGEGSKVREAISASGMASRLRWIGSVEPGETQRLLSSAQVYVLPSLNEVFPMSILEAFRAGTPVVTTDSLGLADRCTEFGAAVVTDASPRQLAEAVMAIVRDHTTASDLRLGGLALLNEQLDIDTVAEELESAYKNSLKVTRETN